MGTARRRRTHAPDGRASVVGEDATSGICGTINGFRDDVTCRREARAREPRSRGGGDIRPPGLPRQLNWRPDVTRWSVGQCVDHLLAANRLMFDAADEALRLARRRVRCGSACRSFLVSCGRLLIRSQSPGGSRKFIAPFKAQPATSNIEANIIRRFVEEHRDAVVRVQALDEGERGSCHHDVAVHQGRHLQRAGRLATGRRTRLAALRAGVACDALTRVPAFMNAWSRLFG